MRVAMSDWRFSKTKFMSCVKLVLLREDDLFNLVTFNRGWRYVQIMIWMNKSIVLRVKASEPFRIIKRLYEKVSDIYITKVDHQWHLLSKGFASSMITSSREGTFTLRSSALDYDCYNGTKLCLYFHVHRETCLKTVLRFGAPWQCSARRCA